MEELKAGQEALDRFVDTASKAFGRYAELITRDMYEDAVELILAAEKRGNRVHITGIGKPSHVAEYVASLLSSTGTPTYYLHGTEAVHGSCGQLLPGDVVICISNSGETVELKATVSAIKRNGCTVIAVTGNASSWLAQEGDAHLFAGVPEEGGPLDRAPRISVLAEILILQGLSVILQSVRGVSPEEYVMWHPGGALGQLRSHETKATGRQVC
ncbi:KpsF/GutQ family sugar-phosphate isomerase [Sediminispirochaeta smaragdinae]|jgi:arabinose-5-phosphate isomerase|uniref:Arabinose-5-phosphate isomerase n=1 Tax=Sediminispirochaeta smaragdinae (strain DSM 11293 / JCM 15392 / SEBR 4228) TaxID=573413 RepID=E1R455_SEDSS|nr:SIS domain-containing protein [Sediminispirochaeta smaragdinae]ADK80477.1 Arabinose-5-phosphate isomerase [Sediminispirochaeta smaragdinae DSM 11293]